MLLKIFSNEKFQDGKKEVKFSEIFNPIYLALISLDPEGKKVNIAPEKEQIARQVRDYLTSK